MRSTIAAIALAPAPCAHADTYTDLWNDARVANMLLHLNLETGQLFLRADDQPGRRCEYRGPYAVTDKLVSAGGLRFGLPCEK